MRLAVLTALWAALVACAPITVSTDWNPDTAPTMAGWKTYSWLPLPEGGDNRIYNDLFNARLHDAVDTYLGGRGYVRVDQGQVPDFRLGWQGSIDQKLSLTTVNSYYGYGYSSWYGYGHPASGAWYQDTYVDEYEQGTLILDIVDSSTNELVWRGLATAELMHYSDPDKRQARLEEAIAKILENFPP